MVILDGTRSSLEPNYISNAGLTYQLLSRDKPSASLSVFYEPGLQWQSWRSARDVLTGRGINRQIARAYGFLASRYRPGDQIFLMGYSRGAFAVRSLAGVIDQIGLIRSRCATERLITQAYRHYRFGPDTDAAAQFSALYCHKPVSIRMIGVWDTVKALGIRAPVIWRLSAPTHAFHSDHLSSVVEHGYHALALDETRRAFAPEMWTCPDGWVGDMQQMWFAGVHGDIGGQIDGQSACRPLSNIPLTWMLEKAEALGLPLPDLWQKGFPQDPKAPSIGAYRGWARLFLFRSRRVVGRDKSEQMHPSVHIREAAAPELELERKSPA